MPTTLKTLIISIVFAIATISLQAQDISTQGKEFWLSYMHNGFKEHIEGGWVKTQVLISAKRDCTGTISNPRGTWQQEFAVQANNITSIEVPIENCYHDGDEYEQIYNKGIKIVASDTISVYSTNIAQVSFDASFVLPTESLGDDYIIQTYDQKVDDGWFNSYVTDNLTSAFLIVATEDNTVIDITPTVKTLGNKAAGQTFTITLNAGQTYHVRSNRNSSNRDLSGTRVTAHDCKKIAVYNGNTLTCVPTNMSNGFDHIYEQAMPLSSWGKNFVVTCSVDRKEDYVKITSAYDNNVITKNGNPLTTLQANQSYTFKITQNDKSCFLAASQTSAVYLYHQSFNESSGSNFGDPSMVWIAPIEQRIDEVTFSTFDHQLINITKHYINIIVKTEDIGSVYFDGQPLPASSFYAVNGTNEYSFARMQIEHSTHHLRCDHGFNAHVYGFGQSKGYAYMVGSNAINLSTEIIVNDEVVKPNETYQSCSSKDIEFFAQVNYQDYDLLWDFGDGQTSNENPVSHSYSTAQVYPTRLFISTNQVGCTSGESDTTHFFVKISPEYIDVLDTIVCFPFHFKGVTYETAGHYEIQSTTTQGCDSILDLNLGTKPISNISDIMPSDTVVSHWVVPATEFQVNSYDFRLYDYNPLCEWDSVRWELSGNSNWAIDPAADQKSCSVYVVDYTTDTIWLTATVFNECCNNQNLTRKHWLVCSFYGVEDHTATSADFSVVPNPNNGQMTLNFENLTGKINVKVYDMKGNLIDSFETYNETGTSTGFGLLRLASATLSNLRSATSAQPSGSVHSMTYEMKNHAPGIYFFVANGKEGSIAKKVVITR